MDLVIDGLLCYIQSMKDCMDNDRIAKCVIGFYPHEKILLSKESIFKQCKSKMIKRKACDSHPNPADADVNDILGLFDKVDADENLSLPTYVCKSAGTMPSTDFEALASVMCSVRDGGVPNHEWRVASKNHE